MFEIFRKRSLKTYGLCPSHYMSAQALSWDAMLNMKKVEFEVITGADMYLFFQKGMRDGVSCISKRYIEASKKYLISYNPKQESRHSIYLDTNNFYHYVMSKFLATCGFKWIVPNEFDLNKYNSNSSKDCVLKIDIKYLKQLSELHGDYPLAIDKIETKREILSNYQIKIPDF